MGIFSRLGSLFSDPGDTCTPTINPATNLPMMDGCHVDIAGNPYGTDLHSTTHDSGITSDPGISTIDTGISNSFDNSCSSFDSGCSSFDSCSCFDSDISSSFDSDISSSFDSGTSIDTGSSFDSSFQDW